jgi:ribosomal protein S18 acetylase RimI-like enzyme
VESVLSGRHCKLIKLHVAVDNDAAIRLYEKSGYSKVGEEQDDYYTDHTAALVLTKSL